MKKGEYAKRGLDKKNKIRKLETFLRKNPNEQNARKRLSELK